MDYSIYKANARKWAENFPDGDSEPQPFLRAEFKVRLYFVQEDFNISFTPKYWNYKCNGYRACTCIGFQYTYGRLWGNNLEYKQTKCRISPLLWIFVVLGSSLRNVNKFAGVHFPTLFDCKAFADLRAHSRCEILYSNTLCALSQNLTHNRVNFRAQGTVN